MTIEERILPLAHVDAPFALKGLDPLLEVMLGPFGVAAGAALLPRRLT